MIRTINGVRYRIEGAKAIRLDPKPIPEAVRALLNARNIERSKVKMSRAFMDTLHKGPEAQSKANEVRDAPTSDALLSSLFPDLD